MRTVEWAIAAGLFLSGMNYPGAQGLSAWAYHKNIVMNTTPSGANVAGAVKGFPVAVMLSASVFDFTQAQSHGEDIRFTNAAGDALPFEIESWDATAKKAALWVKTDVAGNDKTQVLVMYWGNPAAQSASDSKAVFATADGWVGAWHLGEAGNTAQGGYRDATPSEAHATGVNFSAANTAECRIGNCPEFKNSAKRSIGIVGSKNDLFNLTNKLTFSIWVKALSYPSEYLTIFAKGDDSWRVQMYGIYSWGDNNGKYVSEMCVESGGDACLEHRGTPAELKPNEWHHLTVVHDYPNVKYYIDTTAVTETINGTWTSNPTPVVGIGYQSQMNARWWDGYLDEARVLNVPKDADWVKLDFESQREGSKFLEFGAVASAIRAGLNGGSDGVENNSSVVTPRYDSQGRRLAKPKTSDLSLKHFVRPRN